MVMAYSCRRELIELSIGRIMDGAAARSQKGSFSKPNQFPEGSPVRPSADSTRACMGIPRRYFRVVTRASALS